MTIPKGFIEVPVGQTLEGTFYLNHRGEWVRSMNPQDTNTGWTTYIRKRIIGAAKTPKRTAKVKK